MNVLVRKATINDLAIIQQLNDRLFELEIESFDPTLTPKWALSEKGRAYFADMIENGFVIVAEEGEDVIGYLAGRIGLKQFYQQGLRAELDNMFIDESYRGRGVGKNLINLFLKECKKEKVSSVRVTASAKNKNAIAFYEKIGFYKKDITLAIDL